MRLTLEEKFRLLECDPAWRTVSLPVEAGHAVHEEVLVEAEGPGALRIAASPGMLEGLAADDVIALSPEVPAGYRRISRGRNVCVHLFTNAEQRADIQAQLVALLEPLGGFLDGTMADVGLCFTVPVTAGFPAIERAFTAVVGSNWYYSNVYDPNTNAPLNWWLGT